MKIFDAYAEKIPSGYDAATICLDAKIQADLDWRVQMEQAERYISQGLKIFWELDLGLFHRLSFPLENHPQFLSLCLSLDHFKDTIWQKYSEHSIGLCLYRGNADFAQQFPWNSEQEENFQEWLAADSLIESDAMRSLFCRDVAAEYLDLLAAHLPDYIPCCALLDGTTVTNPILLAQLLNKERYPKFQLGVKGGLGIGFTWEWQEGALKNYQDEALYGICLPPLSYKNPQHYSELDPIFKRMHETQTKYRLISETYLTTEWDGLDFLYVLPDCVTQQGKRKLQGFCAAGGEVLYS